MTEFQRAVDRWMQATFGPEISSNITERNHRLLEETLELVQSLGCTAHEAHQLVDYTFGRPVGVTTQEMGGVMVTLAALGNAARLIIDQCADVELARCWNHMDKIRAKQAGKPKFGPLPGPSLTGDSLEMTTFGSLSEPSERSGE